MGLTINTNIASLIAQYNLGKNTTNLNKTTERLASGLKINHASDDAAGLSISETLKTQIRGVTKASENAQDGINLLQISEGALTVIMDNLQRIRDLTVQAANDTNSSVERNAIKTEVASRIEDIQRIKDSTTFNSIVLLDGSVSQYFLRIGPNSDNATNTLDISNALQNTLQTFLSIEANTAAISAAYLDGTGARQFLADLDTAVAQVNQQRATIGALQSRLESTTMNLNVSKENLLSAESRIRNVDISSETAELAKNQILQQASVTVMAQSNQMPSIALDLLKNL
jgi:flagellin